MGVLSLFWQTNTSLVEGCFTETKRTPPQDIRFTTKGEALYAAVLAWPEGDEVLIQSLGTSLRVRLPGAKPADHAFMTKIR